MNTGRYHANGHGHEWDLDGRTIRVGSVYKSLLAVDEVVVGQNLLVEPLLETRFDGLGFGFIRNDDEVIAARVPDKIGCGPKLVDHLADHHRREAQNIIACHKPIYILERIEVVDACIEQGPALFPDDAPQLFLDQAPGWQSRAGIGETLPFRTPDSALDA